MAQPKTIRMLRRLTIGLSIYAIIAFLAVPFMSPFISAVACSAIVATAILLIVASAVSHVKCPKCGSPFFAPMTSKHKLLDAKLPFTSQCMHCKESVKNLEAGAE